MSLVRCKASAIGFQLIYSFYLHHGLCISLPIFPIDLSPLSSIHPFAIVAKAISRPCRRYSSAARLFIPKPPTAPLAVFPSTFPTTTTILAAVKLSPIHTTTYYYPSASARSIDPRYQYYIAPARTPAKMPGRVVGFVLASNTICRPARDDEYYVMQRFAAHASHCPCCENPYRVYKTGGTLCERGHAYARDVAQYVYSVAGKAYSVIDRSATDARVQIEIPAECDAIQGLLRAVDKGLKIRGRASRPIVTHDQTYHGSDYRRGGYEVIEVAPRRHKERGRTECWDRRPLPDRRDGSEVVEVAPQRRKERRPLPDRRDGSEVIEVAPWGRDTVYLSGRGSLHEKDEKGGRQRRKEQGKPVIVYAEPRRGRTYHC
jgi:hypothetical protein